MSLESIAASPTQNAMAQNAFARGFDASNAGAPFNLPAATGDAHSKVHFSDLASAFGMSPRDFATAFPGLQTDTSGRVAANDVMALQSGVAKNARAGETQIAQICPNAENGGGNGGRCAGGDGGGNDIGSLYPRNATVGVDHPLMAGPRTVQEGGRQVLKGRVLVKIVGPWNDAAPVTPELKQKILRGLAQINQKNSKYEIRLEFQEYRSGPGATNRPTDSFITVNVDNEGRTDAKCKGGQACASGGVLNIANTASPRVVAHELSHLLGVGHSNNFESLTYYEGPRNDPVMKKLSAAELRSVVEAYAR